MKNIAEHLEVTTRRSPLAAAVRFEDRIISYRQLHGRVNRAAHRLSRWRVGPGDRVALFLPNIPEFLVAYLAVLKVGAVAVSASAMLKAEELRYLLEDSGATVLFTTAQLLEGCPGLEAAIRAESELHQVVLCEGARPGALSLDEVTAGFPEDFPARAMNPDDPAAILYTSGTTGKPKGAVLTHGNVISNVAAAADCVGARPGDRHLLYLPLFHCFGQNFIMNMAVASGGTLVMQRRFDETETVAEAARAKVTHFYGVPKVFMQLQQAGVGPDQLPSVRYYFSAAATMPTDVALAWRDRFGLPINEGYGLTETSPFACYNGAPYRPGSLGRPIAGVQMKVLGEEGQSRGPGQLGEICIKGPNVMAGYFRRPDETAEVLKDGWFHSGDIGYRDDSGDYFLVDRQKDMINFAGFKVWPREVEEVLHRHPAVAECAVVGTAHPLDGERVRAFVQLRVQENAGPELSHALRAHCAALLAGYKVPGDFVFDTNIPRTPAGKILKRALRERG
jgi:long-chain acyl-CoA synthetase